MASTGKEIEAHPAFSFAVKIDGKSEAIFSECQLPSLEVDILEQKEGGYNGAVHLLPGRVKPGRVILKRGVTQSNEMLKWYQDVASGKPKAAERQVSVTLYDSLGSPVVSLNFGKSYPAKWTGPAFKSGDSAIAIETLELAFAEVTVE